MRFPKPRLRIDILNYEDLSLVNLALFILLILLYDQGTAGQP